MSPGFRRKRSKDQDDTAGPVLITAARGSYYDDLAARKKRYYLLMSVRIPALLLAAGSLSLWNNPWIALAIVAGSIPIPWIAVIGANDGPPLPKGEARRYTAGSLTNHSPSSLSQGRAALPGERPAESEQRDHEMPDPDHPDHPDHPDESDPAQ